MHTPAREFVRASRKTPRTVCGAFTLIELLTVISIIGILAAIAFGMMGGVKKKAAISQAKTELSVLAQALDAFKLEHGDYPQIGTTPVIGASASAPGELFSALIGRRGAKANDTYAVASRRKAYILPSKFTLGRETAIAGEYAITTEDPMTAAAPDKISLLDPWGNPYRYHYVYLQNPTRRLFLIYSMGPDGKSGDPSATGNMDDKLETNTDNIYATQ